MTDRPKKKRVYIPGKSRSLKEDEELEFDKSAYVMLKKFETPYPCLTFDPLHDDDGVRASFPTNAYLVCGTDAKALRDNAIITIKLENLQPIKQDKEDDEESSSEESENDDEEDGEDVNVQTKKEVFHSCTIPHHGGINRIRSMRLSPTACVCAVWNSTGKVQLWNLASSLGAINTPVPPPLTDIGAKKNAAARAASHQHTLNNEKPLFTFAGHTVEGFAIDWSPCETGARARHAQCVLMYSGTLASGDTHGRIYTYRMGEGGVWTAATRAFDSHKKSVEDVQWSPNESTVLASVSVDRTLRMWDTRVAPAQANVLTVAEAHTDDINVLSWNALDPNLLLSGGDDNMIRVWDVRRLAQLAQPSVVGHTLAVGTFSHHTAGITSVQWSPQVTHNMLLPQLLLQDSTVFAASGDDNQTTIWDIAVEKDVDDDDEMTSSAQEDVPAQLLFIHMGQKHVKEVRWHPQITGALMSTSEDGFDIFKTISV